MSILANVLFYAFYYNYVSVCSGYYNLFIFSNFMLVSISQRIIYHKTLPFSPFIVFHFVLLLTH